MVKSNIIFGYENGEERFKTSTEEHLKRTKHCLRDFGIGHFQAAVNPGIHLLTTCNDYWPHLDNHSVHWNVGLDKVDYKTSNFQKNPWKAKISNDSEMIAKQKERLRRSNISFGDTTTDYDWKRKQTSVDEIIG